MLPHRMHLKGPWEYEWLSPIPPARLAHTVGAGEPLSPRGKLRMPATWQAVFGDASGQVRFRRRFHRPTNLEPHEQVFLVFDGVGGTAQLALNDQPIGRIFPPEHAAEYDVTRKLAEANVLVVDVAFDSETAGEHPGGLWGAVALEIRRR